MRAWLAGDERTLGAFLAIGVLTMAFFRLDTLRTYLGAGIAPSAFLLVVTALVWWSLLSRSFVWLDPAELTWRDFGGIDRVKLVGRRLGRGWLVRFLALGYLLALLSAVVAAPAPAVVAGAAVLAGAGLLALAVARRPGTAAEAVAVLAVAALAVVVRPSPVMSSVLAGLLGAAGLALLRPGVPPVADATRQALVDGWRERVLRVSGVQFLDLALLLPAARPVRAPRVTSGIWLGVLGRARHVPTAVLLALTAVAGRHTFPALPDVVVFTVPGYLALLPLVAGLGELWRSPGRRRWLGSTDTALRARHFLVATALAAGWGVPVCLLGGWDPEVLLTVPVLAACAVRTMTRRAPTYDNLVPVDTPFGAVPARLVLQTVRGPDLGVLAVPFLQGPLAVPVAAAAVALAVLR
jgi:hypothetical protein